MTPQDKEAAKDFASDLAKWAVTVYGEDAINWIQDEEGSKKLAKEYAKANEAWVEKYLGMEKRKRKVYDEAMISMTWAKVQGDRAVQNVRNAIEHYDEN